MRPHFSVMLRDCMPRVWQIDSARYAELQSTMIDSSHSKPPHCSSAFAMVNLSLNIRLLSYVPSLTFANTLALIPFPKWIGPYMV
jgi:hypothetical protein